MKAREPRRPSGLLASWPIRRKLAALVALPILGIVGTAVFVGVSAVNQLRDARTTQSLAQLASITYDTKVALQRERSLTVFNLKEGATQTGARDVKASRTEVDNLLKELQQSLASPPIGGWPAAMNGAIVRVAGLPEGLVAKRSAFDTAQQVGVVVAQYDNFFAAANSVMDVITDSIQTFRSEPDSVRLAGIIRDSSAAVDLATRERDDVYLVLKEGRLTQKRYLQVLDFGSEQKQLLLQLTKSVNTQRQRDQLSQINNRSAPLVPFRTAIGKIVDVKVPRDVGNPDAFREAATKRVNLMNAFVNDAIEDTKAATAESVRQDLWSTSLYVAIGLLATLLMILAVTAIARSIDLPMRRLRSGAVHLASVQLPAAVRKVEEEGPDAAVELSSALPRGVPAGPETVDLSSAVDELANEALRLASSQVRLRRALDDAFVSMSRRSQSMVEKQLSIIDELESTEQDPEQLRNLFRLDHLAARMRRYNDNLLVLAGSQVRTRSSAPVPVAELFRAATSEMEQYERVRLQPVGGASLAGPSAGGLIHLLAELLDNAAMYSPPTSPIVLSAAFTPEGGLLLEVADSGVGIPPAELDRINTRLAAPQEMDTQVPSRMGLFVVGRLSNRGGFTVRLSQRDSGPGTVAEVIVPPALVLGAPGSTGEQPRISTPARGLQPQPQQPALPSFRSQGPVNVEADTTGGSVSPVPSPVGSLPRRPARSGPGGGIAGAFTAGGGGSSLFGNQGSDTGGPTNGSATPPSGVEPFGGDPFGSEPFGNEPQTREPYSREPFSAEPYTREPYTREPAARDRQSGELPTAQPGPPSAPLPTRPSSPQLPSPQQWPPSAPTPTQYPISGPIPGIGGRKDSNSSAPLSSTGRAPGAWDQQLPTELAARAVSDAQLSGYRPATTGAPLIGSVDPVSAMAATTPIFDSISAWFADPNTGTMQQPQVSVAPPVSKEAAVVVDLRESPPPVQAPPPPVRVPAAAAPAPAAAATPGSGGATGSRWAALGDQRWVAANARAAATPEVAGTTEGGLPRRRPGANLLPTASAAAPGSGRSGAAGGPARNAVSGAGTGPDAEAVRGRLGSYQRGLSSARQARRRPGDPNETVAAGLFATGGPAGQGDESGQGGDQ